MLQTTAVSDYSTRLCFGHSVTRPRNRLLTQTQGAEGGATSSGFRLPGVNIGFHGLETRPDAPARLPRRSPNAAHLPAAAPAIELKRTSRPASPRSWGAAGPAPTPPRGRGPESHSPARWVSVWSGAQPRACPALPAETALRLAHKVSARRDPPRKRHAKGSGLRCHPPRAVPFLVPATPSLPAGRDATPSRQFLPSDSTHNFSLQGPDGLVLRRGGRGARLLARLPSPPHILEENSETEWIPGSVRALNTKKRFSKRPSNAPRISGRSGAS